MVCATPRVETTPVEPPEVVVVRTSITGSVASPILTVSLRNSVGSTWTIVLDDDSPGAHPIAWISSGVPIGEPPPTDIAEVLEEHGYRFLPAQLRGDRLRGGQCRRLGFAWRAGSVDESETYARLAANVSVNGSSV